MAASSSFKNHHEAKSLEKRTKKDETKSHSEYSSETNHSSEKFETLASINAMIS